MLLNDIENLLQITITEAQKDVYEARLEAAIDYAKTYCRTDFKNVDGEEVFPGGVKMGIATVVQAMGEKQNVQSQSLGDMSKSFFKNGTFDAAHMYFKPYVSKKVGFK